MSVNGIEDILISRDYNKKKKKSKGFFIIFFMLFIALAGCVGAYWYLTQEEVSSKDLFVQNVSKINVKKILNNEIYEHLASRIPKESSQINSSINFTTDLENEELQDIDITKFKLDISNSNDVINKKSYGEAILNYSGNEVFKLNLIANENEIALASNEILDKYVGVNFDKLKEVLGLDININDFKELNQIQKNDLSENEINEYIKKYFEIALNNITEEKFSVQENIAIENATEDVEVTNYSLSLSQDELNAILIQMLEELKNDDALINKLILISEEETEEENKTPVITPSEIEPSNQEDSTNLDQVNDGNENPNPEENLKPVIPVIQINPVGTMNADTEDTSTSNENETTVDTENVENQQSIQQPTNNDETQQDEENNIIETTNIDELIKQEHETENHLIKIILGKKLNLNKTEFINFVNELIKEVEAFSGDGIIFNVYASKESVEKVNLILPNSARFEIDFYPDDNPELGSNQSYIKMTYLTENELSEKNGFALEIKKEQANASTKINLTYNFIENEKINKKIKITLETEGIKNSKEIKNDIVISFATNKSEIEVAIDNTIQFKDISDLPGINAENCIFLDALPENERQDLLNTIKNQITTLYTSKKENLNFIDTNTYSQTTLDNQNTITTQPPASNKPVVTREQAEKALIDKVVSMMDEAIAKNEEFTIQNLSDLKIDGYKVSSAVTSEAALIVVDVYKFKIDTGFTLTYVE